MINAMNALQEGRIKDVPTNMAYPLLRWCSGSPKNLKVCNKLNKMFFWTKPEIILDLLSQGIDKKEKYIKYPKPRKDLNGKLDLLKQLFYKKYKWSNKEFGHYQNLIINHKAENIEELATILGMENKERKILGLNNLKSKETIKYINKNSLLNY